MSRNKRRGRLTLAKKIERDLELQAEEDRKRAQALKAGRQNGKTGLAFTRFTGLTLEDY